MPDEATHAIAPPPPDGEAELVAFLSARSVPCPRCGYDLRGIRAPSCPECAEPLVLKVGSPRTRFGWLIVAVAPGCFSGVAAVFLLVPIVGSLWHGVAPGPGGVPWPIFGAEAFGLLSAASVVVMYSRRQRIMSWRARRQAAFALGVWGVHVVAFGVYLGAMILWG